MTDNYQFNKSNLSENVDSYSPFVDKQWNYINDINSGVYQNSGLTLVQWDLSSIYNSAKFSDVSEFYITLPIVMSAMFGTANAVVAPAAGDFALLALKSNFINLVHQADIQVDGKTIEQVQPFISVFQNFRMISEMSQNDLKNIGTTLGFSEVLDNPMSVKWNGVVGNASASGGNGLCNNFPFSSYSAGANTIATETQNLFGAQNTNVSNKAIQQKINRYLDTTAPGQGIVGNQTPSGAQAGQLMTAIQLNNEFKPYYTVQNNTMIWYDTAIIKLGDLFDSMKQLGLLKRFDSVIRLYVNCGSLNVAVTQPNAQGTTYGFQFAQSTFTNVVPFTVNYLNASLPATTTNITAQCCIARPTNTSFVPNVNLGASGASHPMSACRLYYSQIVLSPERSIRYIESNMNKKIVYRAILSNTYTNTTAGSSFNQLVNAGIKNFEGVLIIPMISSSLLGFPEYASPFDTFGATYTPLSLINVNASIGGSNLKQNPEIYTFENFIEEVNNFESLTSSDFGVSVGLINQLWWENNRVYYLSSRSDDSDKATPRSLVVSCLNNSNVPIDLLVFTIYLDECTVNVANGKIVK